MPTPQIMLPAAGDILKNYLFGFCESNRPTSAERTANRRDGMLNACQRFLDHAAVGPGDLLDSKTRAEFAKEAYEAYGPPIISDDYEYEYQTTSELRDVARMIVQDQHSLTKNYFESVVQRLQEMYSSKTRDDCSAMTMELTILAAGCDAVRTVCDAIGAPKLPFPQSPKPPQPALFGHVSDYALTSLSYAPNVAWGPYLTLKQLKPDVVSKFDFDLNLWKFASLRHAPASNATSAPTTCAAALDFFEVMYVPLEYFPRFLRVPGPDRHLVRGELEPAAASYTAAKQCRF